MSIIIEPSISNKLGENLIISFEFPIPELVQLPFDWNDAPIDIDGTNGTNVLIPNQPIFPGYGTSGTDTNYVSEMFGDESFIFRSGDVFKNIQKWVNFQENIVGDTDFLSLSKAFRVSYDRGYIWSDFYDFSIENLNKYASELSEVMIEFKYVSTPIFNDFSEDIILNKSYKIGWDKVSSGTNGYVVIDKDYPTLGTIRFFIQGRELNINSIRFGTNLQTATLLPKKGDFIFLNPLFLGLNIENYDVLSIVYTERNIGTEYQKRIYIQKFDIIAESFIERTDTLFSLSEIGQTIILTPHFLMKAFKITGYQLSVNGITSTRTLDIKYRYSNNRKKWSSWEPLTQANVSSILPDKLSFFYVEFAFTRTGTDTTGTISLNDLIFEGDIQNVKADYERLNKFGLREDCDYNKTCECSDCGCNDGDDDASSPSDLCSEELPSEWTDPNCQGTFNPYEMIKNVGLHNKLANDVLNIYGWECTYYRTDVDGGGVDKFLHEYQLFNIADEKTIKVLPAENKFPESLLAMGNMDMSLLETFEVHITKDIFKNAFGIAYRPSTKDRIWLCQANKLYEVQHAQAFKDFMNSSVYYKLRLKPATNDKSIGNIQDTSLAGLMANNSIDALFGKSNLDETNKIVEKDFLHNLTEDTTRSSRKAPIVSFDLQNGANLISKQHYSLQTLTDRPAVIYKKIDPTVNEGDDRSFMCWFNINDMISGQNYNLIDNRNPITNKGYSINFKDGELIIEWNENYYEIPLNINSLTWYGILINFNQRQHLLQWNLYKRFPENTPGIQSSNMLQLISNGEDTLIPQKWDDKDIVLQILGSPMYYTNMRIFKTIIPVDKHSKVLNQLILRDTSNLVVADNVNKRVISPDHKF